MPDGRAGFEPVTIGSAGLAPSPSRGDTRAGIGPAELVLDLPQSWTAARIAYRFTADGTESDPGLAPTCSELGV